jgi:hypothetical protein
MRRGLALALVGLVGATGCGGSSDASFGPEATAVSDGFVQALVADGNPEAAAGFASDEIGNDLDLWHRYLLRDGVQTVEAPGSARSNCVKPFPIYGPTEKADCIAYRLVGRKPIAGSDETLVTTARLQVWVDRVGGRWRVVGFDYTPRLESK